MGKLQALIAATVIVLMVFMTAACSNNQPGKVPSNDKPKEEKKEIYPFTGLPVDDGVDRRAVAVMISNSKQARPQTGLSKADIVFEMLTESNITRFMAIFQSTEPDVVGPVRSAREYFFTLADYYDAIYVFSGAAKSVSEKLMTREMDYLADMEYNNGVNLFEREPFRKAPHNLYLQFSTLNELATSQNIQTSATYEAMRFLENDEALPDGTDYVDGSYAKVDLYDENPLIEFKFDDSTELYTRSQDGEQAIELESEKPIEMANVFIVEAAHEVIDDEGRRAIDIDSGGKAFLLQKGQAQEIAWENRDGRIVPVNDGEVAPFVPGKTWILFVPKEPESEQVTIGK